MTDETVTRDVRIRVEDDKHGIYVTDETADAIRSDAHSQAHERLNEAMRLWEHCNVEDFGDVKAVRWEVSMASHALDTLLTLAPLPDDGEDEDA